jgi:hypothetical protein
MTDRFFFIDLNKESESRFELSKFFQWTDNFDPLNSYLFSELKNVPVDGYFKVQGQDGRPDQISYEIYSDTQYWWVLMIYNDLQTVEEFVSGLDIKYPSISSLEDLYFSLKTNEQAITKNT